MVDDARLGALVTQAEDAERAVRRHLAAPDIGAGEQARAQAAYRHAVALRRALEEWSEMRAYRAPQTT